MDHMEVPQQITVKIPFNAEGKEDFSTSVLLSWTIQRLKRHLEENIPRNPKAEMQKLILSGRILQDNQILKDCFKSIPRDCTPVIHMVCSRPADTSAFTENTAASSDGLRQRHVLHENQNSAPDITGNEYIQNSGYPTFDQNQHNQMMLDYQNYMQGYMMSFSQMMPGPMAAPVNRGFLPFQFQPFLQYPYAAPPNVAPQPTPQLHHAQQPNRPPAIAVLRIPNGPVAEIPAAAAAAGLPNVVVNQPINNDDDNGLGNRDVLDWAYMLMRLLLLLCIIYVYSSTARFFSAFTMLALFLLFNTIRDFRRWRDRYLRQQRQAREAAVAAQAAAVPGDQALNGNVPADMNAAAAVPNAEQHHGLISTVFNLVVGFVASIIPDNAVHAVVN